VHRHNYTVYYYKNIYTYMLSYPPLIKHSNGKSGRYLDLTSFETCLATETDGKLATVLPVSTMGGLTQENDGKHIQQSQGCGFEECWDMDMFEECGFESQGCGFEECGFPRMCDFPEILLGTSPVYAVLTSVSLTSSAHPLG
jgi:hypothetical protein